MDTDSFQQLVTLIDRAVSAWISRMINLMLDGVF